MKNRTPLGSSKSVSFRASSASTSRICQPAPCPANGFAAHIDTSATSVVCETVDLQVTIRVTIRAKYPIVAKTTAGVAPLDPRFPSQRRQRAPPTGDSDPYDLAKDQGASTHRCAHAGRPLIGLPRARSDSGCHLRHFSRTGHGICQSRTPRRVMAPSGLPSSGQGAITLTARVRAPATWESRPQASAGERQTNHHRVPGTRTPDGGAPTRLVIPTSAGLV